MHVKLPSGKEVKIGVSHTDDEELILKHPVNGQDKLSNLRGTRVKITLDGVDFESRSVCKPPDNFCKLSGRRIAANRLLKIIGDKMDRDDKREIFLAICPQYK